MVSFYGVWQRYLFIVASLQGPNKISKVFKLCGILFVPLFSHFCGSNRKHTMTRHCLSLAHYFSLFRSVFRFDYFKIENTFQASEDHLKEHYAELSDKPFYPGLCKYMSSGPVVPMVWEGLNVVKSARL